MDRRDFLRKGSAGAIFGGLYLFGTGCGQETPAVQDTRRLDRLGVQLYTLRSIMPEDVDGIMEQIAEIGYREVEFAGYYDRSPAQISELLNNVGLTAPAAHLGLNAVRNDLDELLETANTIGHQYLIVPSLPGQERETIDDYRRLAEEFNEIGERCRDAGVRYGYHNHAFEFEETDGEIPMDVLIEETDPALVSIELDLYWAVAAGQDPVDYFQRYPGRFQLCHVKDRTATGDMVDVGQGDMDFATIFAYSEVAGLEHYIVEHDNPEDPLESIRNSYDYLSEMEFRTV